MKMKMHKEAKKIAVMIKKIEHLYKQLAENLDLEGVDIFSATLVSLDKEIAEKLQGDSAYPDDYLVEHWTGYCEDDYHGNIYFKTDVPGQYVRFYYNC